MAKNSLRFAVEQYGLELCQTHKLLKGKKFRHSDDAREAEKDCLVFKATVGEHDLAGTPHFVVDLEIESRSSATPEINDSIVAAIYECFLTANTRAVPAVQSFFGGNGFLRIEDETSSERADTNSLRVTKIKIPLRARLADDLSPVTARA